MPVALIMDDIITDAGTQMRVKLSNEAVESYMEAETPPVKVFCDGDRYYLADGFHRFEAKLRLESDTIDCDVEEGTLRDAILYAVQSNADHGVRRSNADKRKAVTSLLKDSEWSQWSDREIARQCQVHHSFVAKIRKSSGGYIATSEKRKAPDGKSYPATHPENIQDEKPQKKISGGTSRTEEFEEEEPGEELQQQTAAEPNSDQEPAPVETALGHGQYAKQQFRRFLQNLNQLEKEAQMLASSDEGVFLLGQEQDIKTRFANLRNLFKSNGPDCVCFRCDGAGCQECREAGWLSKMAAQKFEIPKDVVKV